MAKKFQVGAKSEMIAVDLDDSDGDTIFLNLDGDFVFEVQKKDSDGTATVTVWAGDIADHLGIEREKVRVSIIPEPVSPGRGRRGR